MISGAKGLTVTANVHTGEIIHAAPIKFWDMAEAFTNVNFEWEEIGICEAEHESIFGAD